MQEVRGLTEIKSVIHGSVGQGETILCAMVEILGGCSGREPVCVYVPIRPTIPLMALSLLCMKQYVDQCLLFSSRDTATCDPGEFPDRLTVFFILSGNHQIV